MIIEVKPGRLLLYGLAVLGAAVICYGLYWTVVAPLVLNICATHGGC